jgi:hypothetical protein
VLYRSRTRHRFDRLAFVKYLLSLSVLERVKVKVRVQ